MTDESARPQSPDFIFLVAVLLAAQALGTMATSTLPAIVPKVAETYDVSSALISYQISLLAAAMLATVPAGRFAEAGEIAAAVAFLCSPEAGYITSEVYGVTGGRTQADWTEIKVIRLGGLTINNLPIAFADVHPFRKLDLMDKPAILLGMDALKLFDRVSVDFANREVRLLLPGH